MTKLQLLLTTLLILLVISVPFIALAVNGTEGSINAASADDVLSGRGTGADGRISVLVDGFPMLYGPQILQELHDHAQSTFNNTIICANNGASAPLYSPPGIVVDVPFLWVTQEEANALSDAMRDALTQINNMPRFGWFAAPPRRFDQKTRADQAGNPPIVRASPADPPTDPPSSQQQPLITGEPPTAAGEPPAYDLRYGGEPGLPVTLQDPAGGEGAWTMWEDFNIGFYPGQLFTLTLNIEGNTGFNAMAITMTLPDEVEFVYASGAQAELDFRVVDNPVGSFVPGSPWNTNRRVVMVLPGATGSGTTGGSVVSGTPPSINFYNDGAIIRIDLRIRNNVTGENVTVGTRSARNDPSRTVPAEFFTTDPITFSFRNRFICDNPTRVAPGVTTPAPQENIDLAFVYNYPAGNYDILPSYPCSCGNTSWCSSENPIFSIGGVLINQERQRH